MVDRFDRFYHAGSAKLACYGQQNSHLTHWRSEAAPSGLSSVIGLEIGKCHPWAVAFCGSVLPVLR